MKILSLFLMLCVPFSYVKASCDSVASCVDMVSSLTGQTYYSGEDLSSKKVKLDKKIKITQENANDFISELLYEHGLTRTKSNIANWRIINARDIRYDANQMLTFGVDEIPKNHDYTVVRIPMKDGHNAGDLARNFRPFMTRYGRIIDIRNPATLIISDIGINAHRLIELVKIVDVELTEDQKKQREKNAQEEAYLKRLRARNCAGSNKK
jgi:general secretion pathway protein D